MIKSEEVVKLPGGQFFSYVKPILCSIQYRFPDYNWCIAGGAIRDLALGRTPRDYDVFAIASPDSNMREMADNLVHVLRGSGLSVSRKSTSSYALTSLDWFGQTVEICIARADDPISLALGFDYNVCLAAAWLEGASVCYWADKAMLDAVRARSGSLILLRDTTPDTTLRRGFVFQHRFGLKFRKVDILHLARKLLEKNGFTVNPGGTIAHKPVAPGHLP